MIRLMRWVRASARWVWEHESRGRAAGRFWRVAHETFLPRTALHLFGPWAPEASALPSITLVHPGGRVETMSMDEFQRSGRGTVTTVWHHARKGVRSPVEMRDPSMPGVVAYSTCPGVGGRVRFRWAVDRGEPSTAPVAHSRTKGTRRWSPTT